MGEFYVEYFYSPEVGYKDLLPELISGEVKFDDIFPKGKKIQVGLSRLDSPVRGVLSEEERIGKPLFHNCGTLASVFLKDKGFDQTKRMIEEKRQNGICVFFYK
jgi:hypothetical protein